jgi:hypothetical protein
MQVQTMPDRGWVAVTRTEIVAVLHQVFRDCNYPTALVGILADFLLPWITLTFMRIDCKYSAGPVRLDARDNIIVRVSRRRHCYVTRLGGDPQLRSLASIGLQTLPLSVSDCDRVATADFKADRTRLIYQDLDFSLKEFKDHHLYLYRHRDGTGFVLKPLLSSRVCGTNLWIQAVLLADTLQFEVLSFDTHSSIKQRTFFATLPATSGQKLLSLSAVRTSKSCTAMTRPAFVVLVHIQSDETVGSLWVWEIVEGWEPVNKNMQPFADWHLAADETRRLRAIGTRNLTTELGCLCAFTPPSGEFVLLTRNLV